MTRDSNDSAEQTVGTLFLSWFGLGSVPLLPGTVTSFVTAGVLLAVSESGQAETSGLFAAVLLAIAGTWITVRFGRLVTTPDGKGDPRWVVSDEVAGQALACIGALAAGGGWQLVGAAFFLFRVLDVFKPWPVGPLERVPGPLGILLDDVAAGVIAGLAVAALSMSDVLPV